MKRLIVLLAVILSATAIANAQYVELTDITLNTETEQIEVIKNAAEPHPHWFFNAGIATIFDDIPGINVRVGKYRTHGLYCGVARYSSGSSSYSHAYSQISAGYIFNIPFSHITGMDKSNCLQLFAGGGYGNVYTKYSGHAPESEDSVGYEIGIMLRIGKLNFSQSFQYQPTGYECYTAGVGIIFGK